MTAASPYPASQAPAAPSHDTSPREATRNAEFAADLEHRAGVVLEILKQFDDDWATECDDDLAPGRQSARVEIAKYAAVPGVAPGQWVTPDLHREMFAHRVGVPIGARRRRTALCGLTARSWQDIATCPPGARSFESCAPCDRELGRRAADDDRAHAASEIPAATSEHRPIAAPWHPAGFAATPSTGATR